MAPSYRPRILRKDQVPLAFKNSKPQTFSESARPSALAPNIRCISWSPQGSLLATSTSVNIRVWNAERPDVKVSSELRDSAKSGAHTNAVEKVAFCPRTENLLASTGLDGMVKVWDVRLPGGSTGLLAGGGSAGNSGYAGSGPGGMGASSARGSTTGKAGEHKIGDQGLFLTWHPNGIEVLIGRRDDVVYAIDVRQTDGVLPTLGAPAPAPTGPATFSNKYTLTPTDRTPLKDNGSFNQMTFSHSGRELFATTAEGPVKVLSYPTMQPLHHLTAHTSSTYAVQPSPAGTSLAVGASDSMITLWDTTSWLCTQVLRQHASAVRDLSFSPDGAYLVAGSGADGPRDGERGLEIYHVDTGECVHTLDTTNAVTWTAWHPSRYVVAYAGDPGGLKVVSASGV